MRKKSKCIVICSLLLLTGCSSSSSVTSTSSPAALVKYSDVTTDAGFDTFIQLQEWAGSQGAFEADFKSVTDLFSYYNELFDIYNSYDGINNIKTINDNAGIAPVKVAPEIIAMLKEAREFYDLSGGQFDITMGSVLSIWHQYREKGITANENGGYGELPTDAELQEAAQHIGWQYIEIDEQNSTVYITDPEVSLDVGGIAKGFATELAAKTVFAGRTVLGGVLNAGGNNRTLGDKADGSAWRVRVQDPDGDSHLLLVEESGLFSFVTSGDYERYYIATDGNRYHHIIDPTTLYPATRYRSVTIITPDSGVADCLSTTLFTLSIEDGRKVLDQYKSEHPGTLCEAVWLMDEDKKIEDANGRDLGEGLYAVWTDGMDNALIFENGN